MARADNGEPPLPVTVLDPEAPVAAPEPAQPPPPIVAIPADAPLLAVSHGREPLLPRDGTPEPPMPPLGISVTFSVTPTQVQPGSLVTYTVSLRNPSTTPLRLELQAALPPSAHAASGLGQGWVHAAWARALTTTLVLPPRATLVRSFSTKLAGIPEGDGLEQLLVVTAPGIGQSTASARVQVERPVAAGRADPQHGGALRSSDGRVQVEFPPGAVSSAVRLEQRWKRLGDALPDRAYGFFVLELDAFDELTGAPVHAFAAPVTVTLDLSGLRVPPFMLAYFEETTQTWREEIGPLTPDPVTGQIRFELEHFSDQKATPAAQDGWKLQFNDASVGLFNGSASYAYPVEIPPGTHGLQPTLALNYNSSRIAGQVSWVQSDWSGLSWSAGDEVDIMRTVGYGPAIGGKDYNDGLNHGYSHNCAHLGDLCFNEEYTLVFHGTSYRLIPDPQDGSRYHTADESFMKIQRKTCTEDCENQGGYNRAGNYVHDYWELTPQDGTVYRLGYRSDSEQRRDKVCIDYRNGGGGVHFCGTPGYYDLVGTVVWRWRLDRVTDVYNSGPTSNLNAMEYHYREEIASDQYKDGNHCDDGEGWCYFLGDNSAKYNHWDRASYLEWIGYSWRTDINWWGYEVVFDRRCRHDPTGKLETGYIQCSADQGPAHNRAADSIGDGAADSSGDNPEGKYGNDIVAAWQTRVLDGIRVLQVSAVLDPEQQTVSATILREYRLSYDTSHDTNPVNAHRLASRVLTGITLYGRGGYGQAGSLPGVTFGYTPKPNRNASGGSNCNGKPTYPYGRLSAIDNGYGARITLAYEEPENVGAWNCQLQFNWRVASKTVTDTVSPAQVTTYAYSWPCYADPDSRRKCVPSTNPPEGIHSVSGYGKVVATVHSGSVGGTVLSTSEHRFVPDDAEWNTITTTQLAEPVFELLGREKRVQQLDTAGHVLQEQVSVYTPTRTIDWTGDDENGKEKRDAWLVHQDETIASQYDVTGALLVRTRSATSYEYTYGKPVAQYSYGATRLITNGGFEQGTTGWTKFENPGSTCSVGTAPSAAVIGSGGAVLTHTNTYGECGLWQEVPSQALVAGTTYVVAARVRAGTGGASFRLWLNQGDGGNHQWNTYSGSGWQVLTQTILIESTAYPLRIHLAVSGGTTGAFEVDDVYYERQADWGDEKTSTTDYVSPDASKWIVALPSEQSVYTGTVAAGTRAARGTMAYNGNGALVAQGAWANVAGPSGNIYTSTFGYDSYGNQTVVTDTRGYTSTMAYDPIYHTYVMTSTNAAQPPQTSYLRYDFGLAKVISATNANNVETGLIYDSFGRLIKVIEAGDDVDHPSIQYTYTDNYQANGLRGLKVETIQREVAGSDAPADVVKLYEFYSGRGILVQSRVEMGSQASPQHLTPLPLAPSPLSCCREATPEHDHCFFPAAGEGRGGWG